MIFIFSIYNDFSTTEVIEWLEFYGEEVIRINQQDNFYVLEEIDLEKSRILIRDKLQNRLINLLDAHSIWYRKGGNFFKFLNLKLQSEKLQEIFKVPTSERYVMNCVFHEINVLMDYIFEKSEKYCKSLGRYSKKNLNKLVVLDLARQVGLNVPCSYIFNSSEQVLSLIREGEDLITKPVHEGIYYFLHKYAYYSFTEQIKAENMDNNIDFFHSLFQKQLKKKYEIRSFYLDGEFYSMAIFSQSNTKTMVDYRKYDHKNPNRYVPYKIPKEFEQKLRNLMNLIELNTGSIDLVVDQKDKLWFLEINPVGQFGMVSQPCNYYLEEKVANFLRK